MRLTISVDEKENAKIEQLANTFGISKAQVVKSLVFKCNKLDKLKPRDYNYVYMELLKMNKNIEQLTNILKEKESLDNGEILYLLYELKDEMNKIKEKV